MITLAAIVMILASRNALAADPATKPTVVRFAIDSSADVRPISPYIYGMNQHAKTVSSRPLTRIGGNRWTAYNWENNASNAGSDWHHQSDDFMSKSDVPGEPVRLVLEQAAKNKQALVVTVPIGGYVSADKGPEGDVNQTPDYLNKRFRKSLPKKNSALSLKPDLADAFVYQDEFVNWVEKSKHDPNQVIFYSLDNEPDLWSHTHARIHPEKLTYAELAQKTIDFAGGIKGVKPDAMVFGAVNYGWNGYRTLQNAPDENGRDFHQFFLAEMKKAEASAGLRLLDVLDVHWYPEARGDDVRVTGKETTPDVVAARVQSPRSLWDPTYVETSWITKDSTQGKPIAMIPRLKNDVEQFYPGTKIAITEYNYGGADHISGAIAQADVLGIFGQQGIFAACWWPESDKTDFIENAFDMYQNYDGKGGHFGDQSIAATSDDIATASVYASVDEKDPSVMTIVLINRSDTDVTGELSIKHATPLIKVETFQLTSAAAKINSLGQTELKKPNHLSSTLPAYSVTTLRLSR
ncbi:MAG: endoglucanase A [Anaerolineae bacterium]|nr:endoglucanase A [Phycisphaerae bacterium]